VSKLSSLWSRRWRWGCNDSQVEINKRHGNTKGLGDLGRTLALLTELANLCGLRKSDFIRGLRLLRLPGCHRAGGRGGRIGWLRRESTRYRDRHRDSFRRILLIGTLKAFHESLGGEFAIYRKISVFMSQLPLFVILEGDFAYSPPAHKA
jgi:hypothetical protein